MTLATYVAAALERGASDLHLEPSMPPTLRVAGELRPAGDPVPGARLLEFAKDLLAGEDWNRFVRRRSADVARTIRGVRCRINVLQSSRGVGLCVRLLPSTQPTIERLNLHPDLAQLAHLPHGLILIAGPTGSGKSSTLAALVHEINATSARHIVTLEQPIEFVFAPRRSLIRQREVGVDTPSFRRGVLDAMREDPDVIVVGEMRDATTMRLTINAAETGHLVLTTVHSSSVIEALHRIGDAFPPETRSMVCAQLADALAAVVAQTLHFDADAGIRIPECEILRTTTAAKALIRQGQFVKLQTVLETGGTDGQLTRARYRAWLARKERFHVEKLEQRSVEAPEAESAALDRPVLMPQARARRPVSDDDDVIIVQPPSESLSDILDEL